MAGHSKWATTKHKKAAADAKRGKLFTKLVKNITLAARGGSDPEMNPSLRAAIAQAKTGNLPKDKIETAILKGAGELPGEVYEEVLYEGYGPGGAAFIIECVTDNTNRSVSAVRSTLTKNGGSLGNSGSVTYLFAQQGVFRISREDYGAKSTDDIELLAIDGGAEDIQTEAEGMTIYTARENFAAMLDVIEGAGMTLTSSGLEWVPGTPLELDAETTAKVEALVELLDDEDDVSSVYTNLA